MVKTLTPELGADNGWFNALPPPPPARRITGTVKADWVVIGAGVTGLAAARRLAEHLPDKRVLLVEAERVGSGTSGRNSGFLLHCNFMRAKGYGNDPETIFSDVRLHAHGVETLRRLVGENQIECQWHEFGMLWAGAGELGDAGVRDRVSGIEMLGQEARSLDRRAMARITGSDFYTSGVIADGTVLVQPAAMCRGLARTLPDNVDVYEQTPVIGIHRGRPCRLIVANGEIETDGLVLCTNTFSPALGFGRNRMVPGALFASLTRPLSSAELDEVGEDGPWGILPGVVGGSTVRRTTDNRVLMRNGFSYVASQRIEATVLVEMRAQHRASIAKRWPGLADVEIVDTWGGIVGSTRNRGHIFGLLADRIWGSIACNGANMARGTTAGGLLADMIVGAGSALLDIQLSVPKPSWLPLEPILGFFARRRRRQMAAIGVSER